MSDAPIRVLIADDNAVVRRGLRTFLELQDASSGRRRRPTADVCRRRRRASPDVDPARLLMPESAV